MKTKSYRLCSFKTDVSKEMLQVVIFETFYVFPFVKTSGYHIKAFVFKLNQIHNYQTTVVEKHLRR